MKEPGGKENLEKFYGTGIPSVIDLEIEVLLQAIYSRYGYDFREYSKAHIRRRVLNRIRISQLESVSMLQHKVLHEPGFADFFLKDLSITVTEMFRDPDFYKVLREKAMPLLKTWSYIKIWHAGCSTGEEVYSMAILLQEEGLLNKTMIYATDFNQDALDQAKEGIFPMSLIKKYAQNYQNSGAKTAFSDYYHAQYDSVIMNSSLKKNIVWANHNLVTDSDFTETHLIVCRNVLIYFNEKLQNKVHRLFHTSLVNGGILCLGNKESIRFTDFEAGFQELDNKQKIYKKKYP